MPGSGQTHRILYAHDEALRPGAPLLCGVDEAGRGPLCGPVAVAAVMLPPGCVIVGVDDSKRLSEKKREELYEKITQNALCYQVVMVSPAVIDEINILNATLLGMRQAVQGLAQTPDLVLVDGNRLPNLPLPMRAVVKGDATSAHIAAASILAKVERDRLMAELDAEYPMYGLAQHKGYPTRQHYQMLEQYGVQAFYRKTFLTKRGLA